MLITCASVIIRSVVGAGSLHAGRGFARLWRIVLIAQLSEIVFKARARKGRAGHGTRSVIPAWVVRTLVKFTFLARIAFGANASAAKLRQCAAVLACIFAESVAASRARPSVVANAPGDGRTVAPPVDAIAPFATSDRSQCAIGAAGKDACVVRLSRAAFPFPIPALEGKPRRILAATFLGSGSKAAGRFRDLFNPMAFFEAKGHDRWGLRAEAVL